MTGGEAAALGSIPEITATSVAVAFSVFGGACMLLVVAGLPGTWILIAAAIVVDCLDWLWLPPGSPLTFHPVTIVAAIAVGLVGEALEFALSAFGAKRFGASWRGMLGSVVGGVVGAIAGTFLIPVLLVGTLLGAALGTAAGAIIGELARGDRTLQDAARPALGAVIGRLLGTLAKLPVAIAVWIVLAIAAFRA